MYLTITAAVRLFLIPVLVLLKGVICLLYVERYIADFSNFVEQLLRGGKILYPDCQNRCTSMLADDSKINHVGQGMAS